MADSKHTGEVDFTVGAQKGTLLFDWEALAKLQELFGDEYSSYVLTNNVKALGQMLAIGFERKNPELTAEVIIAARPPVVAVRKALTKALEYAFWGSDGAPKADSDKDASDKKK